MSIVLSSKFISVLQNLTLKDISLAGGKRASLGEMVKAGIPVPGGFVVLTSGFEKFLKETGIDGKIEKILKEINIKDAKSVTKDSKTLNNLICKSKMPESIEKEILAEFEKLKRDKSSAVAVDSRRSLSRTLIRGGNDKLYVAVRSSATSEDSKMDSWAGQLESYLNTTEKNLIGNIKKCWASLYGERAEISQSPPSWRIFQDDKRKPFRNSKDIIKISLISSKWKF